MKRVLAVSQCISATICRCNDTAKSDLEKRQMIPIIQNKEKKANFLYMDKIILLVLNMEEHEMLISKIKINIGVEFAIDNCAILEVTAESITSFFFMTRQSGY